MNPSPRAAQLKRRKIVAFAGAAVATVASAGLAVGANVGLLRLSSTEKVGHLADNSVAVLASPAAATTAQSTKAPTVAVKVVDTVVTVTTTTTTAPPVPPVVLGTQHTRAAAVVVTPVAETTASPTAAPTATPTAAPTQPPATPAPCSRASKGAPTKCGPSTSVPESDD